MVHRRSKEKLQDRWIHYITYFDSKKRELISKENSTRWQLYEHRHGYRFRWNWLEEPVEEGEVLRDNLGRGSLERGIIKL